MKFKYFPPPEHEKPASDQRFLPSLLFSAFSPIGEEQSSALQGMYCRRIPQIIKIKLDLLERFRTSMIIPMGKSKGNHFFLDVKNEQFWKQDSLFNPASGYDYMVGGSLSVAESKLNGILFSGLEDSIIYQREFEGEGDFFDWTNEFTKELLVILEIVPSPEELEIIEKRPVRNRKSFFNLIKALEYDPRNKVYPRGETLYMDSLKKSLENDPESADVAEMLIAGAKTSFRLDEVERSEEICDFVLGLRPVDVEATLHKIRLLIHKGDVEGALSLLEKSPTPDGSWREIPYLLGREFMETHLTSQAIKLFSKAVEMGYGEPPLYDSYGYLLILMDNQEEALKIINEGLEKFPDRERAMVYKCQLLADSGDMEQAASCYEKAIELFPQSPMLHTSYGVFHLQNGDKNMAEKEITLALDISPENPGINLEAARMYDFLENGEESLRLARTAIELAPNSRLSSEAQDLLSRVAGNITPTEQSNNREQYIKAKRLLDDDKPQECVNILDQVTRTEPLFWKAWFLKGSAHRQLEQFEDALVALSQVDELFPDQISLHHEIGRTLMGLERFREAFLHLLYAFRKRPHDPIIMANMGLAYLFTGKINEAEVLLNQAKKMDPNGGAYLDPYIEEIRKIQKRKETGRGNGGAMSSVDDDEGEDGEEKLGKEE